jgi:hypothetical protein
MELILIQSHQKICCFMDISDLRTLFHQFVGDDRYRKFLRTINLACRKQNRLLYWQEQLWSEFNTMNPEVSIKAEDIIDFFCICDVHNYPLGSPENDDLLPAIRDTPEYEIAYESLFPFAIEGNLICIECLAARELWVKENSELCRILRCQTTYEDYCDRRFPGLASQPNAQEKVKIRSSEIAAQMELGDELWEWDAGGWHRLAGRTGVAIVRNGEIVKQWCELKS